MHPQWDANLDAHAQVLVRTVCDTASTARERDAAWKALLVTISPFVEAWARRSPLLARCRLTSEDDARAVLVAVIARLWKNDQENLRSFLARRPPTGHEAHETEEARAVEQIVRLAAPCEAVPERAADEASAAHDTPLRGWILGLLRFVTKDYVLQRLGWGASTDSGPPLTKRDLGTDAERLDGAAEGGERPPVTDYLTLRRVLDEIRTYLATFPSAMKRAFDLWLDDATFEHIADTLALAGPDEARALTRAAQARLRDRFRDRWPELRA